MKNNSVFIRYLLVLSISMTLAVPAAWSQTAPNRENIDRIKANKKKEKEQKESDPHREKRQEVRKLQAKMKFLQTQVRDLDRKINLLRIGLLGGQVGSKDTKPAEVKKTSSLETAIKFTVVTEEFDEITPLDKAYDAIDDAGEKWDAAMDKVIKADEEKQYDNIDVLLQEEAEAAKNYRAALEGAKKLLLELKADPALKEDEKPLLDDAIVGLDEELADVAANLS